MGKHKTRQVALIPIATPLAGHRLTKKIGTLITQSCENKSLLYGVKDSVKSLKKKEEGICILGGNVTPMDVITHIPIICEEKKTPYVFFPTKEQISTYAQRTSPVACVIIKKPTKSELLEEYNSIIEEIKTLSTSTEPQN